MYIKGVNKVGNTRTTIIKREFYLVDNLTTKALISINILKLERVDIILSNDTMRIESYSNLKVLVKVY